jgi:hypothetical protein
MIKILKIWLIFLVTAFLSLNFHTHAHFSKKIYSHKIKNILNDKSIAFSLNASLVEKIKEVDYVTLQTLSYAKDFGGVVYNEKLGASVPKNPVLFSIPLFTATPP